MYVDNQAGQLCARQSFSSLLADICFRKCLHGLFLVVTFLTSSYRHFTCCCFFYSLLMSRPKSNQGELECFAGHRILFFRAKIGISRSGSCCLTLLCCALRLQ